MLAHQLSLRLLRQATDHDSAVPLPRRTDLIERCLGNLPFKLTNAQRRVWLEIANDLERPHPMMRLVQGDVGSGKTVVAALAALRAVEQGLQAAIMAPTELLAEQHARNFLAWLEPLGVRVALLTGRQTGKTRAALEVDLAAGDIDVAVGTHALFQEGVEFRSLAVVVVDEQHRFGVHQRLQLREKGKAAGRYPHQLVMTATPIPRTLAMTAYADLDVSIIDELPPGRTPIRTVVLPDTRRSEIVERIDTACRAGRQAYWVCPLIDESDLVRYEAAEKTAAMLAAALPGLRIGLVHGRMAGRAEGPRDDCVQARQARPAGGDDGHRGGRRRTECQPDGRRERRAHGSCRSCISCAAASGVVRSKALACCFTRAPLTQIARERLAVLRETNDGFEVSRRDLELRGPGELLGTRQTGLMNLRVADLVRDADMLPDVQRAAALMLAGPQENIARLVNRWVGTGERFRKV